MGPDIGPPVVNSQAPGGFRKQRDAETGRTVVPEGGSGEIYMAPAGVGILDVPVDELRRTA